MPVLSPSFAVAQQPPRQRGPRAQVFCKYICFSLKGVAFLKTLCYVYKYSCSRYYTTQIM